MQQWAVIQVNERDGESFVIGPFESLQTAFDWAMKDAVEKATSWNMTPVMESDCYISVSVEDGGFPELIAEWQIEPMIAP